MSPDLTQFLTNLDHDITTTLRRMEELRAVYMQQNPESLEKLRLFAISLWKIYYQFLIRTQVNAKRHG